MTCEAGCHDEVTAMSLAVYALHAWALARMTVRHNRDSYNLAPLCSYSTRMRGLPASCTRLMLVFLFALSLIGYVHHSMMGTARDVDEMEDEIVPPFLCARVNEKYILKYLWRGS
jgi:hypothetical protein